MPDLFPERIGPYLPERLLGRGAMAAVYLCRSPDGQAVAVKWTDQPHPPLLRRFDQEIASLQRMQHPGIVRCLDHGEYEGRPYLVMEHIDGVDLRVYAAKLHQRPPIERYARCRTIGRALTEVLEALHAEQLVHRDIKPTNVIIAHDGRVVLTDFGVVKDLAAEERTLHGTLVGTPAYAAPEQVHGERVDGRADLFGLGATLYLVLTLRPPFEGRDRSPASRPLPPSHYDPGVPADLEAVILRLMAPEAQHRFADAQSAGVALAAGRDGGVVVAGRQDAVEAVASALDQARSGLPVLLFAEGTRGSGRGWLVDTARQGARRRGVPFYELRSPAEAPEALARLAQGEAALVLSTLDLPAPPGAVRVHVRLPPLGVADVRRTVVSAAPLTHDPARVATRLHGLTGGIPGLLVPLLRRYTRGEAVELPDEIELPEVVSDWLTDLDPDQQEVLWALALQPEPGTATLVEEVLKLPAEPVLQDLALRGLVQQVGARWHIPAEVFRRAALDACWDVEGIQSRLADAHRRRGGDDPPLAETLEAVLGHGASLAAHGRLAAAHALAERAAGTAGAIDDRDLECAALCLLGQVLLDLGLSAEAGRHLADATALARATDRGDLRRLSHALRAQASLLDRNLDRTACVTALDRLIPITTGASRRPADFPDALAIATQGWAAAAMGDGPSAERSRDTVKGLLPALDPIQVLRVRLALVRACLASGDRDRAAQEARRIAEDADEWALLAWQAARLEAQANGEPPPPPGALAEGLAPPLAQALGAWR